MDRQDLYVVGYPRSGSTWTSRLLGDVLDSPVTGQYSAHPLAEEGLNRPGPFTVRQLHLRISYGEGFDRLVPSAWMLAAKHWQPGIAKFVSIVRDPRDVAVSAWKYWEIESLEKAIRYIGEGQSPLLACSWQRFVGDWLASPVVFTLVHYETLLSETCWELARILDDLDAPQPAARIEQAAKRQSIEARRQEIASGPDDTYMYGKTIQLKHLRKGISGDWRNHFTPALQDLAWGYFGKVAETLGYGYEKTFKPKENG